MSPLRPRGVSRTDHARQSLLHTHSPPASSTASSSIVDPNVMSSLFPTYEASTEFTTDNNPFLQTEVEPDQGALQFVPAFEGSWDAEEKKEAHDTARSVSKGSASPRASPRSSPISKMGSSSPRTSPGSLKRAKQHLAHYGEDTTASRSRAGGGGNRIQRLASLFSSRAVVRGTSPRAASPSPLRHGESLNTTVNTTMSPTPPSPAQSGSTSSDGYIGWPGTQNKRGDTVLAMPSSSFEDGTISSAGAGSAIRQRTLQQDAVLATNETSQWTGASGSSKGFHVTPSPNNNKKTNLERRMCRYNHKDGGGGTKDEEGSDKDGTRQEKKNARAAVVTDTKAPASPKTSLSAMRYAQSDIGGDTKRRPEKSSSSYISGSDSISFHDLFPTNKCDTANDPWGKSEPRALPTPASPGETTVSKTSSAYFNPAKDMSALSYPDLDFNPYGAGRNEQAATAVIRQKAQRNNKSSQPPTAEMLAAKDHLSPPHRSFNTPGYRGLIDKTKEVPSLMDAMDSDSMSSSKATSTYSSVAPSQVGATPRLSSNFARDGTATAGGRGADAESDVFDGLSITKESDVFDNLSNGDGSRPSPPRKAKVSYPERIVEETESTGGGQEDFKLVLLGGGLTAIQTTHTDFSKRQTASDFDENLTNSDIDQFGFAKIPGFDEIASAGRMGKNNSLEGIDGNLGIRSRSADTYQRQMERDDPVDDDDGDTSGSSLFTDPYGEGDEEAWDMEGDLFEYYVNPLTMKKLLRKYRMLSERVNTDLTLAEFEREEDENKAFALFEMRSRIMEKDMERGLERRGGTVVVDDLVMTPYNRTAHRIRDAVIVSKAWRDGASPEDVINTALLTRRANHVYFIKRPMQASPNDSSSVVSGYSTASQRYFWEAVKWVDDTDFMQYRCPSLGPRYMRGFEIFTIGDCQSILLKLTNERCMELRLDLNAATAKQIEAEELMKDEGDAGDGMMTEAEMQYLTSMEEVKTISKQLVVAEKAFTLVRDRIEKLMAKYESLLVKFESESFAASSIVTSSSYYTEDWEAEEEREKEVWARRAQRAELKAELAAREALLAKQEARMIEEEKQRELDALKQQLFELRSESSFAHAEKEQSAILAKSFAMRRNDTVNADDGEGRIDKTRIDGVKQRFRARMAAKMPQPAPPTSATAGYGSRVQSASRVATPSPPNRNNMFRFAGEEMLTHLDFYERSLKAVEDTRGYS